MSDTRKETDKDVSGSSEGAQLPRELGGEMNGGSAGGTEGSSGGVARGESDRLGAGVEPAGHRMRDNSSRNRNDETDIERLLLQLTNESGSGDQRKAMTEEVKNSLKMLKALSTENWTDYSDFFIEFESICRSCRVEKSKWLIVFKVKTSPEIVSFLKTLEGYPDNLSYEKVRDGIINHYGPRDPLRVYDDQLINLKGQKVIDLERQFFRLLDKREAARLRLGVEDERSPSNREIVDWWLNALPARIQKDVRTGMLPMRVDIGPGKPRQYPSVQEVIRLAREYEAQSSTSEDVVMVLRGKRPAQRRPDRRPAKRQETGKQKQKCFGLLLLRMRRIWTFQI